MEKQHQPEKKIFCLYDAGGDLSRRWFYYYYEGKKRVKVYGDINRGKTLEDRRRRCEAVLHELQKNFKAIPASIDEQQAIYEALEFARPHLEVKSYQTYKSKIDQLFEWLGDDKLTTERLRIYFKIYRESHTQQGTYDCRRQLMTFFKKANLDFLLKPIKIKKGESKPLRYFQPHQRQQILDHLAKTDKMLFLHCIFIYFTGIRPRKELVRLRVDDIFWQEKKIMVRGEFSKNHKTQAVGIAKEFIPFIQHLKREQPGTFIFPSARSKFKPAGRNTYGERFRAVLDYFGYNGEYMLYSWKHTGAVEVYKRTKNIIALQRWARHSDVRTTQLYLRQLGIEDFPEFYNEFPSPV